MTNKKRVPARVVRERYGVSDMTLWRWLANEALAFPPPIYINSRRYWAENDLDDFDARQAAAGAPAPTGSTASTAAA